MSEGNETSEMQANKLKFSENPSDVIWVNATKTGRGATIALNGDLYVGSIQSLQKLVAGDRKGARFVKIIR